jgi:sugar/nucleoside kinase (ribokinase family)
MADIWVLGSAAWDHVYQVDDLPAAGTPTRARILGPRPGGSTANVARGLASAGHAVHLVAQAGTDVLGDALVAELASYGVNTEHMQRCDECTPETLIFIDRAGERTIFIIDKDCAKGIPVPLQSITEADAVFVGCFADYEARLPSTLRRSRALVVTAVPAHDAADDWCADIVIGSAPDFVGAWLDAPFQHLRERVGDRLRWVVVTHGEQGASAYSADSVVTIPPVETPVVDTTGAGDSFTSGLMHGLLQGNDIATAGALGAHWAAAALKVAQSVPPRWIELQLGPPSGDWSARFRRSQGNNRVPVD